MFMDQNDINLNALTGVRPGETFNSLYEDHKQGVLKRNKKPAVSAESDLEKLQKSFKSAVDTCQDPETFDTIQQMYLDNKELKTPENEKLLNELGKELKIEDYL